jgi:DNA-binding response OmpR family regulator
VSRPILVLDDDDDFAALLTRKLSARDHQVLRATRGAEATLALARQPIDLLIVDGLLPDTDGISWIAALRAAGNTRPIIFVSAFWRDLGSHRRLTHELGVQVVLRKPVSLAELCRCAEQLLSDRPAEPAAPGDSWFRIERSLNRLVDAAIAEPAEPRVLLIGAGAARATALRSLLEGSGACLERYVDDAADPAGLLALIAQTDCQLILLDAQAPSALETCRRVRALATGAGLPVLLVGLSADLDARRAAFRAGADDYLLEPLLREEAITRITGWLERAGRLRDPLRDPQAGPHAGPPVASSPPR